MMQETFLKKHQGAGFCRGAFFMLFIKVFGIKPVR